MENYFFTELIIAWVAYATYMWGGSITIGARPFWGRGVFVLVISNINIGFPKLLTLTLKLS